MKLSIGEIACRAFHWDISLPSQLDEAQKLRWASAADAVKAAVLEDAATRMDLLGWNEQAEVLRGLE